MANSNDGQLMADGIHEGIFGLILSQEFMPGDRLSTDALARRFSVSQTPVRQALNRLQTEGLVSNKRNAGFRVSDLPSQEHLVDVLEFRIMFETTLVAKACERITSKSLKKLKSSLTDLKKLAKQKTLASEKLFATDAEFHNIIACAAGNSHATSTLERLLIQSSVFRLKFAEQMITEVLDEHTAIAEAIAAKDSDEAIAAMQSHLHISVERVKNAITQ